MNKKKPFYKVKCEDCGQIEFFTAETLSDLGKTTPEGYGHRYSCGKFKKVYRVELLGVIHVREDC